jgi:tetratricopeptide (TPR) repeat protein
LGAYTASLASKAVGVTLPAVVWLAAGLGIISKAKRPRWLDWLDVAGVVVLTLLYLWIRGLLDLWILPPFAVYTSTAPVRSWDVQCFTQLKALVYYAYLAVMPVRLTVEHAFFESSWIGDASVWLAALFLGSLGWVWWGMPKRFTLIKFCILAALVALAPATLVPLNVLVNEHRIYLSMAFLSIAWAWCLMPLLAIRGLDENHFVASHRGERLKFRFGTKGIACVFLFLSLLGLGTFQRNKVWLDEISLWQDAVRKAPTMYRTHMHLAGALMKEGNKEEALKHFERAASLAPDVVETHYNLGNAWKEAQNVIKAKDAYERSLALNPQFVAAWVNLAALYQDLKEYGKAENRLLKAEAIDPDAADIKRRLGIIYGLQNRLDAAEKMYLKAIDLKKECAECYYSLANLYFTQKRYVAAVEAYKIALDLQANDRHPLDILGDIYYNLGDTYLRLGHYNQAEETFTAGLRQASTKMILYYDLARAQDGQGYRDKARENYRHFLPYAQKWPAVRDHILRRLEE